MSSKQPQIFISYARSDKNIAEQLTRFFEQQGYSVWIDYKMIKVGSDWQSELENALRKADVFVIVLSDEAVRSNWINAEIGYALGQKKLIIPILVEEDVRLPLSLSQIQYLDARKLKPTEIGEKVALSIEKLSKKQK